MAGRRQHYLPRLLQRGFLDASVEAERTWLHRRGGPAKLVGIADVGVGEYFYSRPVAGEVTLDDVITDLEGDLSAVIGSYRATAAGAAVDPMVAARTVHHLVTRTAHIRSLLSQAGTRFFESIETLFADPGRLATMMGLGDTSSAPQVVETIREAVARLVPLGLPAALSERLLSFYLREKGPGHLAGTSEPIRAAFAGLLPTIADQVRETHSEILSQDPADHLWIETLSGFSWHVEHREGLILPDAVGLASDGEGPLLPLLFTDRASAAAVVLPVASDRLLVGLSPAQR